MPSTQQIIRILIFALIFVVPVVIRLVKAAGEAKEKRRIEQARQYQISEAMRTGRPIEPIMMAPPPVAAANPQQTAQDRPREMAARRQAQIEALRRQRQQAPQGGPAASRPPTAYQQTAGESAATAFQQKPRVATGYQQQAPVATGYQQQAPVATGYQPTPSARQAQRPPQARATRRAPQARAQPARQAPPPPAEQAFPPPTGDIGGSSHDHDGDVTHRLVPDAMEAPKVTGAAKQGGGRSALGPVSRVELADLRRAVVLREVLGAPVALREAGEAR